MASILSSLLGGRRPLVPGPGLVAAGAARLLSATAGLLGKKPAAGKVGRAAHAKAKEAAAKARKARKRRKGQAPAHTQTFLRVRTLRRNMFSPAPPPLRMARLRHLRHWTVHRAWQLFRRQQHEALGRERDRLRAGLYNACEELRRTVGPGARGEGYLYRVAMEKKGVWGRAAVPIEYARLQTDSPARVAWDHDWKR